MVPAGYILNQVAIQPATGNTHPIWITESKDLVKIQKSNISESFFFSFIISDS